MQRWRLCLVVILVAATACSNDKPPPDHTDLHPEETAVLPTVPPTTAPPTTPALGEQVTTVEAAQRLLDLFAHLDGEAARMLLQKGAPDAEFDQALQAVYIGDELDLARQRFARGTSSHFSEYVHPQPDVLFKASRLEDSRRTDCVVVGGTADLRPRYTNPVPVVTGAFILVARSETLASGGNPTHWRMLRFGELTAQTALQEICPSL